LALTVSGCLQLKTRRFKVRWMTRRAMSAGPYVTAGFVVVLLVLAW